MVTETDHSEQQKKASLEAHAPDEKGATTKLLSDAYPHSQDQKQAAPSEAQNKQTEAAKKDLPNLTLTSPKDFTPLPWQQPDTSEGKKLHMNYEMQRDSRVKLGEGPFHVAERLLGRGAKDGDVQAFTKAMVDQLKAEQADDNALASIPLGRCLVDEKNISQIMDRITDDATRERIADRLKLGWNDAEQPLAVPFDHDARPGETQPSYIPDTKVFLKDLAAAAIDVGAEALRAKGQCAAGARAALNELPLWKVDGGTVDRSINKDPNGWRSGIKLAQDLGSSGLFDVVPLSKIGVAGLKPGYMVGRFHHPEYVKTKPTWEGEDFGDIDIVTSKHRPQADGKFYIDSFVLIPKEHKK